MTLEKLRQHFVDEYMAIAASYYYEGSDKEWAAEEAQIWADQQIEKVKEVYES